MQVAAEATHQDILAEESVDTATSTGSPRRISEQGRRTLQQAIQGVLQPAGTLQEQPNHSDPQVAAAEPEEQSIDIDPLGDTGGFILPEEDFDSDDNISIDSSSSSDIDFAFDMYKSKHGLRGAIDSKGIVKRLTSGGHPKNKTVSGQQSQLPALFEQMNYMTTPLLVSSADLIQQVELALMLQWWKVVQATVQQQAQLKGKVKTPAYKQLFKLQMVSMAIDPEQQEETAHALWQGDQVCLPFHEQYGRRVETFAWSVTLNVSTFGHFGTASPPPFDADTIERQDTWYVNAVIMTREDHEANVEKNEAILESEKTLSHRDRTKLMASVPDQDEHGNQIGNRVVSDEWKAMKGTPDPSMGIQPAKGYDEDHESQQYSLVVRLYVAEWNQEMSFKSAPDQSKVATYDKMRKGESPLNFYARFYDWVCKHVKQAGQAELTTQQERSMVLQCIQGIYHFPTTQKYGTDIKSPRTRIEERFNSMVHANDKPHTLKTLRSVMELEERQSESSLSQAVEMSNTLTNNAANPDVLYHMERMGWNDNTIRALVDHAHRQSNDVPHERESWMHDKSKKSAKKARNSVILHAQDLSTRKQPKQKKGAPKARLQSHATETALASKQSQPTVFKQKQSYPQGGGYAKATPTAPKQQVEFIPDHKLTASTVFKCRHCGPFGFLCRGPEGCFCSIGDGKITIKGEELNKAGVINLMKSWLEKYSNPVILLKARVTLHCLQKKPISFVEYNKQIEPNIFEQTKKMMVGTEYHWNRPPVRSKYQKPAAAGSHATQIEEQSERQVTFAQMPPPPSWQSLATEAGAQQPQFPEVEELRQLTPSQLTEAAGILCQMASTAEKLTTPDKAAELNDAAVTLLQSLTNQNEPASEVQSHVQTHVEATRANYGGQTQVLGFAPKDIQEVSAESSNPLNMASVRQPTNLEKSFWLLARNARATQHNVAELGNQMVALQLLSSAMALPPSLANPLQEVMEETRNDLDTQLPPISKDEPLAAEAPARASAQCHATHLTVTGEDLNDPIMTAAEFAAAAEIAQQHNLPSDSDALSNAAEGHEPKRDSQAEDEGEARQESISSSSNEESCDESGNENRREVIHMERTPITCVTIKVVAMFNEANECLTKTVLAKGAAIFKVDEIVRKHFCDATVPIGIAYAKYSDRPRKVPLLIREDEIHINAVSDLTTVSWLQENIPEGMQSALNLVTTYMAGTAMFISEGLYHVITTCHLMASQRQLLVF